MLVLVGGCISGRRQNRNIPAKEYSQRCKVHQVWRSVSGAFQQTEVRNDGAALNTSVVGMFKPSLRNSHRHFTIQCLGQEHVAEP
jgi:hypothetical protein